jgi:hypothetical protein
MRAVGAPAAAVACAVSARSAVTMAPANTNSVVLVPEVQGIANAAE